MMKITLFALAALALVCGAPQDQAAPAAPAASTAQAQPAVQILKQDSDVEIDGYHFEFETSDGTSRQEQGEYKNDTEQQGLLVRGSYKYTAPDGQQIQVTYVADKNGYQPSEQADSQQAGSQQTDSQQAGSQQTDSQQAGSQPAASQSAASQPAASEPAN